MRRAQGVEAAHAEGVLGREARAVVVGHVVGQAPQPGGLEDEGADDHEPPRHVGHGADALQEGLGVQQHQARDVARVAVVVGWEKKPGLGG